MQKQIDKIILNWIAALSHTPRAYAHVSMAFHSYNVSIITFSHLSCCSVFIFSSATLSFLFSFSFILLKLSAWRIVILYFSKLSIHTCNEFVSIICEKYWLSPRSNNNISYNRQQKAICLCSFFCLSCFWIFCFNCCSKCVYHSSVFVWFWHFSSAKTAEPRWKWMNKHLDRIQAIFTDSHLYCAIAFWSKSISTIPYKTFACRILNVFFHENGKFFVKAMIFWSVNS